MVDRAALEMRSTGNRTGGSNPSLSAIHSYDIRKFPQFSARCMEGLRAVAGLTAMAAWF